MSAPEYWQGKHENVADSGCLRVSRILVNKASGDSVLQVLGNKARKNCQIVPVLPMYRVTLREKQGKSGKEKSKEIQKSKERGIVRKEKETQTQTFRSDIFGWGGGLPRKGVGAQKFGMSFETQGKQTFSGYPGVLAGYPRGVRKV